MLGRRIGSWILERELGRGGMGAVFQARHASLQSRAAVKVLSAGLESEEAFRQRFRREAELQAQLRHQNVARVLDYLEDGGQWFLVIEYLEQGSLADFLNRGERVSHPQAILWIRQALAGLAHAHEKGIVHRDIKPANLMFSDGGEIVVVDFGIARADAAPGLTNTGMAIGTPHYMSPEQIMTPNRVDGRADIYSLGIVLYELLAGRRPFEGGSEFSVLQAQVSEPPPPLRTIDPSVPPRLEAIVLRALAKKPEDRYFDCGSMIRALDLDLDTRTRVPEVSAPADATVEHSVLHRRATLVGVVGPSPGDLRDQKRRSLQRRLVTGALIILLAAIGLAVRESSSRTGTVEAATPFARTESAVTPVAPITTTTAETTATTASTTSFGSDPIDGTTQMPLAPRPKEPQEPGRDVGAPPVVQQASMLSNPSKPKQAPVPNIVPAQTPPATVPRAPISMAPIPVLPPNPRIAVIGMGSDPVLAGALEQEMERRLGSYEVADEHGIPEVDERLNGKGVTPQALGADLLKNGFHVLVLARVEEGAQRDVKLAGQSMSAKAARLRLNAYLLPANRPLGSGWTELVEYTEVSAAAKARQVFIGPTADLRQAIDDEWGRLRAARQTEKIP